MCIRDRCEQTAGCAGCTGKSGVCGKSAANAKLQDQLTGALIGLAHAASNAEKTPQTDRLILEGLFTTVTNVNFNDDTLTHLIDRVNAEKNRLLPGCANCASPCGNTDNYDMSRLWNTDEDIRSLKSLILFGIRGMAAYAYHAMILGYFNPEVNDFFYRGLFALSMDWGMEELLPLVLETGKINLLCMEPVSYTHLTLPTTRIV